MMNNRAGNTYPWSSGYGARYDEIKGKAEKTKTSPIKGYLKSITGPNLLEVWGYINNWVKIATQKKWKLQLTLH